MKNLFLLLVVALFVGGCSYKNESIELQSYKADYAGAVSQENKSVHVSLVKDTRGDQRTLGYVLDNGVKTVALYTDVDFEQKYREGLGYALRIADFKIQDVPTEDSLILEVYIKDVQLIYNGNKLDENLKGEIEIEVVMKKGAEVITQNFREKGGRWITMSHKSKDLEPFLHTIFTDSINNIVSRLTKY